MPEESIHISSAMTPANYAAHLAEVFSDLGGDTSSLLASVGITREALSDPDGLIEFNQLAAMMVGARDALNDPAVGLKLGSRLSVTAHGVLGFAAICASTPREALDLLLRYIHTRTPVAALEIVETEENIILRMHEQVPLGAERQLYVDAVAASVVTVLNYLLSGNTRGLRIRLPYPQPDHADAYEKILEVPVAFDAGNFEVLVPARFLSMPMPLADPAAKEKAARQCEEELQRLEGQLSISDRVRQALVLCRREFPGQAEMAARLCLSERTLRRRLQACGISYRELLEEVRQQLARQMLDNSPCSVHEIAFELGYEDPSNFGRAFRRWTGLSPGEYRQIKRQSA